MGILTAAFSHVKDTLTVYLSPIYLWNGIKIQFHVLAEIT